MKRSLAGAHRESSASVSGSQGEEGLRQEAEADAGGSKWGRIQLFLSKAGTTASAGLGLEEAELQLTGAPDC